MVRHGMVWYDMGDMVRYGMGDMVWYDMGDTVRYVVVLSGVMWCNIAWQYGAAWNK